MSEGHVSKRTYGIVFAVLMVLLAISVGVARLDLGPWNLPVAMGISVAKAVLVVLFFMHVYYAGKVTQVMAAASLLWICFMLALTFQDFSTRGWKTGATPKYDAGPLDRAGQVDP